MHKCGNVGNKRRKEANNFTKHNLGGARLHSVRIRGAEPLHQHAIASNELAAENLYITTVPGHSLYENLCSDIKQPHTFVSARLLVESS